MKRTAFSLLPLVLLTSVTMPAQADGLLGIIGGSGDDALITLGSGAVSDSGLVNVGLGGDNLLDVQVGGDANVANATVGLGGGSLVDADVDVLDKVLDVDATVGGNRGLVDANVNLLNDTARVTANVGGNSLVDVGVGIGGGGNGGNNGGGGNGGNNGGGGNGGNNGGGNNGGGNGGGPIIIGNGTSGGVPAVCQGANPREVQRLIEGTRIGGNWQNASNVTIRRVDICPEMQTWLAAALTNSGLGNSLHSAIAGDSLLSASLNRSSYSANRVFAVQQRGNQLTMFVY